MNDLAPQARSPKLQNWHLSRSAIVYIRQSTPQQVLDHRESTARQYALADRAVELGWARERVVVIDDDLGKSGQSAQGRPGFQRLLAELALDRVGLILGLEMSRLARSCKDWHQLLELCACFRTLLADADGLYDPTDYHDRLLLGLTGIMSEAELHILKGRMNQGKWNKARRGELYGRPPIGYVRGPSGAFEIDPDEHVQSTVRLIFEEFERQGTLHGLLRYLVHHQILMPVRVHRRGQRDYLEWRRPNRETLQDVLHHPVYAGAYRYGHRPTDPRRKVPGRPGTGRLIRAAEGCAVLIRDHGPAYIDRDRFEANQRTLAENRARAESKGTPRPGPSSLGGIPTCGRCGRRMTISYGGVNNTPRYNCSRGVVDYAEPPCRTIPGRFLDDLVAERILAAMTPAALEASLAALADVEQQRRQLDDQWRKRLERARYETERAARQYHAVEPENRLVGRELERRWEEALRGEQALQHEHDRHREDSPKPPDDNERAEVLALAQDLPGVWAATTTTPADRQRVARLLLDRIVVAVIGKSDQVDVRLEWAGGFVSTHRLVKAVSRYDQKRDWPELSSRLKELYQEGYSAARIAAALNREGFRPPKRTERFEKAMIHRLLNRCELSHRRPTPEQDRESLGPDEWFLSDLAEHLEIPKETIHRRRHVGWVHARKGADSRGRWILWADADELNRLRQLRACPRTWDNQPLVRQLIIPRSRANASDNDDR
jgi:DNA invertase Pin-like site-specific DNA recombinase